jgi:hypothetical protein
MTSSTPRGAWSSTNLALAALAIASVAASLWLSLQPDRLSDLHLVAEWCAAWLRGAHLYGASSNVDYPPWAIVLLSPLGLLNREYAFPALWITFNVLLLVAVARLLAVRGDRRTFLLLLMAGAMRTLNQFSLLSFALALAGARARGPLAPILLGLSLFKPQIGGVVWLAVLFERRWRLALTSLAVPFTLLLVYAIVVRVSPLALPADYARVIATHYGAHFIGQTEITPWLRAWLPSLPGFAAALLVAIVCAAPAFLRNRTRTRTSEPGTPEPGTLAILGLCSLLSLRHLSYDFILLLPLVAMLRGPAQIVLALVITFDPAGVSRELGSTPVLAWPANHADRLLALGLWAWMSARIWMTQDDNE